MDGLTDGNSAAPASTGPTTFAEAFASDASSATDPSASTTTTPAAAQPALDAAGTTPAAKEDRSPFIPRARFDEVNTKYGELTKWKEQYGWAETVDRAAVAQALQIAQAYQSDRPGYIRQLLAEAIADPQLAPAVRSEAARLLGQRPQAAPPPVDLTPLSVEMTDGQTRNLFTAEQLQAFVQQELAKVREEFKPAVQTAEELRAEKEAAAAQQKAESFGRSAVGELEQLPGFKEHAKEIGAAMRAMTLRSDDPEAVTAAAYRAYASIVLPKLNATSQSKLLDDLRRQAAASTSPNPGSAAPTTPRSPRSFYDRELQW